MSPIIKLNEDLVDSANDMHGSTSTAVRADAEALLADCKNYGKQYIIEHFIPQEKND